MNRTLLDIAERRRQLLAQSAAQRAVIADSIEPWRAPLALADQAISLLRVIRSHPAWLFAGAVAVTLLPHSRLTIWLRRAWLGAQIGYALLAKSPTTRL